MLPKGNWGFDSLMYVVLDNIRHDSYMIILLRLLVEKRININWK